MAVLGNHDHRHGIDEVEATLSVLGITLLRNSAVRRGVLTIAGLDDSYTANSDIPTLTRAIRDRPGPVVLLTHGPDVAPDLPAQFGIVLAGHTHCGQVALPLIGPLFTASQWPLSNR